MAKKQKAYKTFDEYKEAYYAEKKKAPTGGNKYVKMGMMLARESFERYHQG
ncbi:MAG: hypothetical protein OEV87_02780 [Phycisphaerae bacterium]|nr:hypothetical protein [Phycisphaerae bacterium]